MSEKYFLDDLRSMEAVRGYIGIGLYFVVLALYWLVQAAYALEGRRRDGLGKFRRWKFGCKSERSAVFSPPCSPPDHSSLVPLDTCPTSRWCIRLQRWPVEPAFRLAVSLVAVASEATVSTMHERLENPTDVQRITIYALFSLSGFVDVLRHFGILYPAGTGHFVLTLAFSAEAFFYNTAMGSADIIYGQYIHLSVSSAVLCAVISIVELFYLQQIGVRLLRSYFVLLHGTWLLHVGVVLLDSYGAKWYMGPSSAPWANVFFFGHVVGVFVLSSMLSAIIFWVKGQCRQGCLPPALPWCSCTSVDDLNDGFRHTPSDNLEETEPLALHP